MRKINPAVPGAILAVLICLGAIAYVGSLRPLAPAAPPEAPDPQFAALAWTATPTRTSTPTETLTPEPSPSASREAVTPTVTAKPSRTGTATPTPDEKMTQTAIPAQKTLDAVATRAFATWTPAAGPTPEPRLIDKTTNFLLLGSDLRPYDPSWTPSTDVVMVLFVDGANQRAALLSFPRDLVVAIPHHKAGRINYVFQYGLKKAGAAAGAEMVKQVLHDEFGIRIDHWAQIDLNGFQKIIDTLGGIDIDVPCPLQDTVDDQPFVIPAGKVHMDYVTAKRYVQSRYTTSDTSRNYRQQRVLWAIVKKGLELGALDKLPTLWGQVQDSVHTDMSLFDMAALVPTALALDIGNHPDRVHARVLEYPVVYPFVSAEGAWLFMPDYLKVDDALGHLFESPGIGAGKPDPAECPALPATATPAK
ncbi:MAG: LCP family protein [Rudaea sp.]